MNMVNPRLSTLACLFVFASTTTASPAADRPIQVFILAGQSNMEGQGVVAYDHPKYYTFIYIDFDYRSACWLLPRPWWTFAATVMPGLSRHPLRV